MTAALLALRLFAGNALSAAMRFFSHLTLWQALLIGACVFALVQHFEIAQLRHTASSYKTQRDYYLSELQRTVQKYEQAQKDAHAKNLSDIARVKAQQEEITNETVSTLNARLERITGELRAHPDAKGGTEQPPVSQNGYTPCRAFDPAWLCLSPSDRLSAAQNEERHDQLIDWVIQQSKIDPNTEAAPK